MIDAERAARLAQEYDSFGGRRAGTAGDAACAQWLLARVRATGARADALEVPLAVRSVVSARIDCRGERFDGMPLFDAPDTPAHGITGALLLHDAASPPESIGLMEIDPGAAGIKGMPLEALRRASRHAALVMCTRSTGGELAPVNAQYYGHPFGPPVLQIAGERFAWFREQAVAGARAHMVIESETRPGRSYNLVAHAGSGPAPFAVLTPRTSWWESTAERAGGIIAWLAVVEHAAQRRSPQLAAFASCAHELGHIGLAQILAANAALVADARVWIHLGANLGCASARELTIRATDPDQAAQMRALLVANGYPERAAQIEPIDRAMGESRDLMEHGARVISLIGRNGRFHAPSDRWPANVDAAAIAAIGRALTQWIDTCAL